MKKQKNFQVKVLVLRIYYQNENENDIEIEEFIKQKLIEEKEGNEEEEIEEN